MHLKVYTRPLGQVQAHEGSLTVGTEVARRAFWILEVRTSS